MRLDILSKLKSELSKDFTNESQVLYLLAEIRKILDGFDLGEKSSYPNLYFYCNWVLHISMDRTPAQQILKRFELHIKEANSDNIDDVFFKLIEKESNFYFFIDLKKELEKFLELNKLPKRLIAHRKKWGHFIHLLLRILTDCPLEQKKGRITKFFFIKKPKKHISFAIEIAGKGTYAIDLIDRTEEAFNKLGVKY